MKQKLLYVINYITNGGPSHVIRTLIRNLEPERYDITLLTLFSGNDPSVLSELNAQGIHIAECTTMTRLGAMLGHSKEFDTLARQGHFDVIHTHGFIPDILSSRLHTDSLHISTLHNNMFEDYLSTYGSLKSKLYILLHLHALRKLDCCVCCAKSVYDVMSKKAPLEKLFYIRNGIDPLFTHTPLSREDLHIPADSRVFIYTGRFTPGKNVKWLTEQFRKIHSEQEYLLLLGDGETLSDCRQFESSHIRFLGFQPDVQQYLQLSDVYISASLSEGFSISVLEALDCGLGLFLSSIPSHREAFEIDPNIYLGELFDFSDDDFSRCFHRLRENAARLGQKEIIRFKQNYLSGKQMTEAYTKLYAKNS